MKLVIVESPTKARTISGFLGKEYKVESSYGHIRDLPKSKIGIDVAHDFEPQYVIPKKAADQVAILKRLAKKADAVILATDEDREGEAIAWHLVEALELGGKKGKGRDVAETPRRIVFRHLLPNCLAPMIVVGTLQTAHAISLEATLSFLGVGLPLTEPSLGLLIANGFEYMLSGKYWISFYPGIALLATIMSINLVGDRLRDVLNPRLER